MFSTKAQDKTSEKELNEVEISNLLEKDFKVMIINMLNELERRMDKHNENLNKIRKYKEPNRAEEYNN